MSDGLTYFQGIEGWIVLGSDLRGTDLLTLRDLEGSMLSVINVIVLDDRPRGMMNHIRRFRR